MKRVIPLISALIIGNCLTLGEIYGSKEDASLKNTVYFDSWNVYGFIYDPRIILINERPQDRCPISYNVHISNVYFPTLAEFQALMSKISYFNNVEEIVLCSCGVGSLRGRKIVCDIPLGTSLKSFSLENCWISQVAADQICSALKTASHIEKFSMRECVIENGECEYLNKLSFLNKLTNLDLRHTFIGNHIEWIEKLITNNRSLRYLNLIGSDIPPKNIDKLKKIKEDLGRDELQILSRGGADDLSGKLLPKPAKPPKPLEEAVIKDISNIKLAGEIKKLNLEEVMYNLTIDNVPISEAEISTLRELLQSQSINVLSVISCGLTTHHIIKMFDGIEPNGTYVDLSNNELDKDAYNYLQGKGWLNVCLFGNPCFSNIEIADKSKLRKLSQQAKDGQLTSIAEEQPSLQAKKSADQPASKLLTIIRVTPPTQTKKLFY